MNNISIIIVNYKSSDKTLKFISKIPNSYQIVIVDNSGDGNLRKKSKAMDNIKIIENGNIIKSTNSKAIIKKKKVILNQQF